MTPVKRPHEGGDQSQHPPQRQRTDSGRPPVDAAALIAAKKAEIQAKLAAFRQNNVPPSAHLPPTPAGIPARPQPAPAAGASTLPAGLAPDLAARIAAAKARVQAMGAGRNSGGPPPPMGLPQASSSTATPPAPRVSANLGIHPSLLEPAPGTASGSGSSVLSSSAGARKPMQPKFTSLKANARTSSSSPAPNGAPSAPKVNPYLAASAAIEAEASEGPTPRGRGSRKLASVQKGKYVAIAEQMRADANMEALRQRIAESARKAGLDSEFDALDKVVRREAPPECEWWDEPLLTDQKYTDLSKIDSDDPLGPINFYVQHPVQIAAPWEKRKVEIRPLMLTKKEAKKMRKQRRMADLKDRQDRVRMGLIPPDAPKVSLKNLMRVLASDAILDPTKVEAKVRRDVANRRLKHEKMNDANKLTDEQRREKVQKEKDKDENKGLYAAVFKIRYLSNPSHKFKVRENAKQSSLTGCCLFNPNFCMVLVEGSAKAIKFYKRVMLVRIDWTEEARARNEDGSLMEGGEGSGDEGENGDEGEGRGKMGENRCDLVWEGPIRERGFNIFRAKNVETEKVARDFLGEQNRSYWDAATKFVPEDV